MPVLEHDTRRCGARQRAADAITGRVVAVDGRVPQQQLGVPVPLDPRTQEALVRKVVLPAPYRLPVPAARQVECGWLSVFQRPPQKH